MKYGKLEGVNLVWPGPLIARPFVARPTPPPPGTFYGPGPVAAPHVTNRSALLSNGFYTNTLKNEVGDWALFHDSNDSFVTYVSHECRIPKLVKELSYPVEEQIGGGVGMHFGYLAYRLGLSAMYLVSYVFWGHLL